MINLLTYTYSFAIHGLLPQWNVLMTSPTGPRAQLWLLCPRTWQMWECEKWPVPGAINCFAGGAGRRLSNAMLSVLSLSLAPIRWRLNCQDVGGRAGRYKLNLCFLCNLLHGKITFI